MKKIPLRNSLVSGCFLFCALAVSGFPAVAAEKSDFLFLETQRLLREEPLSPKTPERHFAAGEYYFQHSLFDQAEKNFRQSAEAGKGVQAMLSKVYLAEIERLSTGKEKTGQAEELENALSSQGFFSAFNETRKKNWKSPLQNRYEFDEYVDRLEIRLNGSPFYTIRLA